jgi:hypothetical protein
VRKSFIDNSGEAGFSSRRCRHRSSVQVIWLQCERKPPSWLATEDTWGISTAEELGKA